MHILNPFLYGNPVPVEKHINRDVELRKLFSRIASKDSSAIVGNPQIGKTSLIKYVLSDLAMKEWLGDNYHQEILSIEIDIYAGWLSVKKTPIDFWRKIFRELKKQLRDDDLIEEISSVRSSRFDAEMLVDFFKAMGNSGKRLLLVIDEFDSLLYHRNFSNGVFFGTLRSLATRTDGLQLVTSSITSVEVMNDYSNELNPTGSPFFNNFSDVNLGLFDNKAIDELIDMSLVETGVGFDSDERKYIIRVSGRHPYRVQVACAALFEAIIANKSGDDKFIYANEKLLSDTRAHFKGMWKRLDDKSRTILVIMVVLHYKGVVLGKDFSFGEIEETQRFIPELELLSSLGLVEKIDTRTKIDIENALVWRDKRWGISSEAVAWWLSRAIIGGYRDIPNFDKWLNDQEVIGYILTRKQWGIVKSWVRKAPSFLGETFNTVVVDFLKKLFGIK